VVASSRDYALKIAPPDNMPVMAYETGMMAAELYWYEKIRTNTSIVIPKIYFTDSKKTLISAPYFIMEELPGLTMDKLPKTSKPEAHSQLAAMAAHMHNIKGDGYGYIQNKLHDNWYQAIRSMVEMALQDKSAKGRASAQGDRLLGYIIRYKDILEKAECRMVSFDLWPSNVIYTVNGEEAKYALIDPERSFWGDPVADFVCLEPDLPLEKKAVSLNVHNTIAETPIVLTQETYIRYAIALGYLALIMETEKHYRYSLYHAGWWRNYLVSAWFFKRSFKILA
jgi:aminoglycoside phosphotransferase (APT) family kinase protein